MKTYCVYIMTGGSGVLYIGVTNDLERRVFEHKNKAVPGFSARYNLTKLVYFEVFQEVRAAITREKELKGWVRRRKVALIESTNRTWADLSVPHQQAAPPNAKESARPPNVSS
jgi:putative endonuclease